jgi:RNA polymerase sigma factor (sigma-70 family)
MTADDPELIVRERKRLESENPAERNDAWAVIVKYYTPLAFAYLLKVTHGDHYRTEELLQQVLTSIYRSYKPSAPIGRYLYKALKRALTHPDRPANVVPIEDYTEIATSALNAEEEMLKAQRDELLEYLPALLITLPDDEFQILYRYSWENSSYSKIARDLQLSRSEVQTRALKAFRRLRMLFLKLSSS